MALVSLVAGSFTHPGYNVSKEYNLLSGTYIQPTPSESFVYQCLLPRDSDSSEPACIVINHIEGLDVLELFEYFRITISDTVIWEIPLWVLRAIGTVSVVSLGGTEVETTITFPFAVFSEQPIYSICMNPEYGMVCKWSLVGGPSADNGGVVSVQFYREMCFVDTSARRALARNTQQVIISQISHYETVTSAGEVILDRMDLQNQCKGLLINVSRSQGVGDISALESVQLTLNGYTRWDYNSTLLRLVARRLDSYTLYIPFNTAASLMESTLDSYLGSSSHSHLDVVLTLRFINASESERQIRIGAVCFNGLVYADGYAVPRYVSSPLITLGRTLEPPSEPAPAPAPASTANTSVSNLPKEDRLLPDDNVCAISYEPIAPGMNYGKCNVCVCLISESPLRVYLASPNRATCPMCRSSWTIDTLYCNRDPPTTQT